MAKKQTGWRGWWQSLWEDSVATSVATSTTVSETVSVAPSAPVSETVSVDPTPTSTGDSVTMFHGSGGTFLVDEVSLDTDLDGHPDVLWYPRWENWAAVKAGFSTWPNLYDDNPGTWPKISFTTAPEFGNIAVARFESYSDPDGLNASGMGIVQMQKYFNSNYKEMFTGTALGSVPLNDLYVRYAIMAESDVWDGMNESGMKLPGFQGRSGTITDTWMHHSSPGNVNYSPPYNSSTQQIKLQTYFHGGDIQAGETFGKNWLNPPSYVLQPDTWNSIEHHWIMNSKQGDGTGNSDGLLEVWFNDELILSFPNAKFRDYFNTTDPVQIQGFHLLVYHGGQGHVPIVPIHYRITGVCLSRRRIGAIKVIP
jgi:hypothetical protein